jgi:hypothetical protein
VTTVRERPWRKLPVRAPPWPPAIFDREHDVVDYDPKAPPRATIVTARLHEPLTVEPFGLGYGPLPQGSPCDPAARVTRVEKPSMARSLLSIPARAPSATGRSLAFTYESGASMQDDFAVYSARRAAFPACVDGAGGLLPFTPAGWALFDQVLAWVAPPMFVVPAPPDASPTLAANVVVPAKDPALSFVIVRDQFLEIVFKAAPAVVPAPGQVFTGEATGGPYARKAVFVERTSAWSYRVRTDPAGLADVFSGGSFKLSGPTVDVHIH